MPYELNYNGIAERVNEHIINKMIIILILLTAMTIVLSK